MSLELPATTITTIPAVIGYTAGPRPEGRFKVADSTYFVCKNGRWVEQAEGQTPGLTTIPESEKCVLSVEGTAAVAAVISVGTSSGISQLTNVNLLWSRIIRNCYDDVLVVDAQRAGTGSISCSVRRYGRLVAQERSAGDFAFVQCQD